MVGSVVPEATDLMRVLIVTTPLPAPGRPTRMAPLARQIKSLQKLGFTMDVLEVTGRSGVKYVSSWPKLRALASQADLIHAHYGYCGWLARFQISKPVVVSFMGSDLLGATRRDGTIQPFSKVVVQLDRLFARTVDAVIVKSPEMADIVKPVRAHVVPNGVDTEVFRPMDAATAKSTLGWAVEKRYVLFPANPRNPRKGFPLTEATVAVAAARTGESLEIVALDKVDPHLVPLYMNACEAMVMSSFTEGSPNVVKEAMACNLPTVSVQVGDVAELLADVEGCAVCPRDPEAMGAQLADIVAHRRRSAGREGLMRKGLDLESVALRIKKIYEDLLAR